MIKINKQFTDKQTTIANKSERKRINFNFHKDASDSLQRMLNTLNTNTYVQPHKHEHPDKREVFIILTGKVLVVEFNNDGEPTEHIILNRDLGNYACEIKPGTWHTIICLENNSVLYEIKDGPYIQRTDKQFAEWAPSEEDNNCQDYNEDIIKKLSQSSNIS